MSDNQKIAFLENDILMILRSGRPTTPKQYAAGYQQALDTIENFKHYLINKESDEYERDEILGKTT